MKYTRATRTLATVFHKNKYITDPGITLEYRVTATSGKLAAETKSRMANHISETLLQQLERLRIIIKHVWTQKDNQQWTPPIAPPIQTIKFQVALAKTLGSELTIPVIVPTPQMPFQHPKGASLPNKRISPTATPPRVVPTPRVEQPVKPRRSPQLVA